LFLTGLDNDYAAWRQAFWTSVENGLKRDEAKSHKSCTNSVNEKCCCETVNGQRSPSQVLHIWLLWLYKHTQWMFMKI